jgi:hypothetical protein
MHDPVNYGLLVPMASLGRHSAADHSHEIIGDFDNQRRKLRLGCRCVRQQPRPRSQHNGADKNLRSRANYVDTLRRPPRRVNDDHLFGGATVGCRQHRTPQRFDGGRTKVDQRYRVVDMLESSLFRLAVSDSGSPTT